MPKIKDLGIKVIPETMRPPEIGGGGGGCTDCTVVQFSICGTTPMRGGGGGCSDCTVQAFSICGGTQCTAPHSLCGFPTYQGCGHPLTYCICTFNSPCLCTHIASVPCGNFSGCGAISPVCGGSIVNPGDPGLNPQAIATLRDQLQKQLAALDEAAKAAGPKTAAEIDAREKQLNDELADLKARRKNLK